MIKYQVHANARRDSEHAGLIAACAYARSEAVAHPGVLYDVWRDGRKLYRAQVRGGALEASWP
ncbi:MAG: hypothetical protein ACM358_05640 [Gemmatimonadota bacterium]